MAYKIWKASIEEYRVLNVATGQTVVLKDFTAINCRFFVDMERYQNAKLHEFKNSGDPFDFFAWIEAEKIVVRQEPARLDSVWYNPFLSPFFRNRRTKDIVTAASVVVIKGNALSYEPIPVLA